MPSRRRWAVAAAAVLLVAFVGLAAESRDRAAADRLAAACMRLRDARDAEREASQPLLERLFEDDAALVDRALSEVGEQPCVEVERRLRDPLDVGAFGTFEVTPWTSERLARFRDATSRARVRCPGVLRESLVGVLDTETERGAAAREACDAMLLHLEAFESRPGESVRPIPLHDWVEEIGAMADAMEASAGH